MTYQSQRLLNHLLALLQSHLNWSYSIGHSIHLQKTYFGNWACKYGGTGSSHRFSSVPSFGTCRYCCTCLHLQCAHPPIMASNNFHDSSKRPPTSGKVLSATSTKSPICKFLFDSVHFFLSNRVGRYSLVHLRQNKFARYCTCLQARLQLEFVLVEDTWRYTWARAQMQQMIRG